MPAQETAYYYQQAVLWTFAQYTEDGQATVNSPVQIQCRWNETWREVTDAKGNTIVLDAAIEVAQPIPIGSLIWLGPLTSWFSSGSVPLLDQAVGIREIKTYNRTPDVKNRAIHWTYGAMRYKDTLPAGVI